MIKGISIFFNILLILFIMYKYDYEFVVLFVDLTAGADIRDLVGLSALMVAIITVLFNYKNNLLSARPYLDSKVTHKESIYTYELENKGSGTAYIDSFSIKYHGEEVDPHTLRFALISKFNKVIKFQGIETTFKNTGSAMSVGKPITLISIAFQENSTQLERAIVESYVDKAVIFEVAYSSGYREKGKPYKSEPNGMYSTLDDKVDALIKQGIVKHYEQPKYFDYFKY